MGIERVLEKPVRRIALIAVAAAVFVSTAPSAQQPLNTEDGSNPFVKLLLGRYELYHSAAVRGDVSAYLDSRAADVRREMTHLDGAKLKKYATEGFDPSTSG